MPKAIASVSDTEETSPARKNKENGATVVEDEEPSENGEAEEEAEEYEIEEIMDMAEEDGVKKFLVKWKNYGHEEDSWVEEEDAGNATELINEYIRKKAKPKGRKSVDAKSAKMTSARKSTRQTSSEVGATSASAPPKKRGRASKVTEDVDQDDEDKMDVDEQPAKKARKSVAKAEPATKVKPKTKKTKSQEVEDDDDDTFVTMDAFKKNWTDEIATVDTVEREEGGELSVYFTLHSGGRVKQPASICRKKFPERLIDFYESNLRWKAAPVQDDDDEI